MSLEHFCYASQVILSWRILLL
uniref:Uncharacterized protein n=1 Tax=Rhizophora mucronata TaxID=61149 RepID=A0A2P2PQ19_RHIMU